MIRSTCAIAIFLLLGGCGQLAAKYLDGEPSPLPEDFTHLDEFHACHLELTVGEKALRMNCFDLGGVLHIHTSRWAKLPRLGAENWAVTARRSPEVRVQIDDKVYELKAVPLDDENQRVAILTDRGYWHAWDGIQIFSFVARD